MAASSAFLRTSAVAVASGVIAVGGLLLSAHPNLARATGLNVPAEGCRPTGNALPARGDEWRASSPSPGDRRAGGLRPRSTALEATASRPLESPWRDSAESEDAKDGVVPTAAALPMLPPPEPRRGGALGTGARQAELPPTPPRPKDNVELAPAPVIEPWQEVEPAPLSPAPLESDWPVAPLAPPPPLPPGPRRAPLPLGPGVEPGERLEPEPPPGGPMPRGVVEPMFGPMLDGVWSGEVVDGVILCEDCQGHPRELTNPWRRLFDFGVEDCTAEPGIGEERVPFAQFEVDHSQPMNNNRLRVDVVYGLPVPDRSEYFWSRIGLTGPKFAERSVDYQDFRFQMEFAEGNLFSIFTELPIRVLDPEINGNTAGFGDMVVGNRAVMIDGKYWQLTQVLRTYINTGDFQRGLGTGHVSMEPGLVLRYRWNCKTYLHGEFKYHTPLGGDPMAAGDVLRYGASIATVAYETDTFAVLPSLEFVGFTFLDGLKTLPPPPEPPFAIGTGTPPGPIPLGGTPPFVGRVVDVDGEDFMTIHSGVRLVLGPRGDLGLFEVGASGGIAPDNDSTFDFLGRLEIRWSY